jgi:predicted Fe-Mo cluster-binding NifX family protein
MTVVALPVYRHRVAPVLDFSHKLLLMNLNPDPEEIATEILWEGLSHTDRLESLTRAGVTTLICGGISESLYAVLVNAGIHVVWGIAGPVEQVLEAFQSDRLDESVFQMPGRRSGCFTEEDKTAGIMKETMGDSHDLSQKLEFKKPKSPGRSEIVSKHGK